MNIKYHDIENKKIVQKASKHKDMAYKYLVLTSKCDRICNYF